MRKLVRESLNEEVQVYPEHQKEVMAMLQDITKYPPKVSPPSDSDHIYGEVIQNLTVRPSGKNDYIKWHAAYRGWDDSPYQVGYVYSTGQGDEQDFETLEEAKKWLSSQFKANKNKI